MMNHLEEGKKEQKSLLHQNQSCQPFQIRIMTFGRFNGFEIPNESKRQPSMVMPRTIDRERERIKKSVPNGV